VSNETEVVPYKLADGGKSWPGGQPVPDPLGPTSQSLDATKKIWHFFKTTLTLEVHFQLGYTRCGRLEKNGFRKRTGSGRDGAANAGALQPAVAPRNFVQVLLVIFLRVVVRTGGNNLRCYR
jgi:hypothetical protein